MIVLESPRARRLPLMQALMNSAPLRPLVAWMARRQVASGLRRITTPRVRDPSSCGGDTTAIPSRRGPRIRHPSSASSRATTARNLIRNFLPPGALKSLGKGSDFKAKRVHVIGAGVMGGDIAAWCAMRGLTVTLQDQSPSALRLR